jgi:hypothetical protein
MVGSDYQHALENPDPKRVEFWTLYFTQVRHGSRHHKRQLLDTNITWQTISGESSIHFKDEYQPVRDEARLTTKVSLKEAKM